MRDNAVRIKALSISGEPNEWVGAHDSTNPWLALAPHAIANDTKLVRRMLDEIWPRGQPAADAARPSLNGPFVGASAFLADSRHAPDGGGKGNYTQWFTRMRIQGGVSCCNHFKK